MPTLAERTRFAVWDLTRIGRSPEDIACELKIPLQRVESILDRMSGLVDEAPATPKLIDAQPVDLLQPVAPVAAVPADASSPYLGTTVPGPDCGTRKGYQKHYASGGLPCQSCKDEWNRSERAKAAERRAARAAIAAPVPTGVQAEGITVTIPRSPMPKRKVLVRWLVPRGIDRERGLRLQFAIVTAPDLPPEIVTAEAAEAHAQLGGSVLSRYVSEWADAR